MAPRIKAPATPVPQTQGEFEELAIQLGEISRQIDAINGEAADEVARIKLRTKGATEALGKRAKALWAAVSAYAEAHRDELLPAGRKSSSIAAGVIGWRTSSPAVRVEGDEDEIIERLLSLGLNRFTRETVELDKTALLAEPGVVATIAGLSIVQTEHLFFKPLDLDRELQLKTASATVQVEEAA